MQSLGFRYTLPIRNCSHNQIAPHILGSVTSLLRRFIAILTFVAFSCAVPGLAQEPNAKAPPSVIYVPSGESTTVEISGITRVAIGDSRIAGVVAVGGNELLVNGKANGHTSVLVWRGTMEVSYEVVVTEQRLDDYARVIRNAIDEPHVV